MEDYGIGTLHLRGDVYVVLVFEPTRNVEFHVVALRPECTNNLEEFLEPLVPSNSSHRDEASYAVTRQIGLQSICF